MSAFAISLNREPQSMDSLKIDDVNIEDAKVKSLITHYNKVLQKSYQTFLKNEKLAEKIAKDPKFQKKISNTLCKAIVYEDKRTSSFFDYFEQRIAKGLRNFVKTSEKGIVLGSVADYIFTPQSPYACLKTEEKIPENIYFNLTQIVADVFKHNSDRDNEQDAMQEMILDTCVYSQAAVGKFVYHMLHKLFNLIFFQDKDVSIIGSDKSGYITDKIYSWINQKTKTLSDAIGKKNEQDDTVVRPKMLYNCVVEVAHSMIVDVADSYASLPNVFPAHEAQKQEILFFDKQCEFLDSLVKTIHCPKNMVRLEAAVHIIFLQALEFYAKNFIDMCEDSAIVKGLRSSLIEIAIEKTIRKIPGYEPILEALLAPIKDIIQGAATDIVEDPTQKNSNEKPEDKDFKNFLRALVARYAVFFEEDLKRLQKTSQRAANLIKKELV